MNNYDIDKVIQDSLTMGLNSCELKDEVFTKIKDNLSNPENKDRYGTFKIRFNRTNSLKSAVSFMCGLIIFCILSLVIFPEARVFASNTINTIKTIFIVNGTNVVEVGQDEPVLNDGYNSGMSLNLSDSEISEKVGYNVVIPSTLSDDFNLFSKQIVLHLGTRISYETNERIRAICAKATLDDNEFENLKEYNPTRSLFGFYSNPEGEIYLTVSKSVDKYNGYVESLKKSEQNYKEIKIGDLDGFWLETKKAVYPNGDMTQKPSEIINTYNVYWVSKDLLYSMGTDVDMNTNRLSLSPEMGIRIAESFMASQK